MKWFIITGLLVLLIVAAGAAVVLALPSHETPTQLVTIGPTPLDDQIDWAIAHSK